MKVSEIIFNEETEEYSFIVYSKDEHSIQIAWKSMQ